MAYDVLDIVAERFNDDIVLSLGENAKDIKKIFNTKSFEMAPLKYNIEIESGSSSFESIESKREDAIAMYNLLKDMANSGADIDLNKVNEKVLNTFEKVNYEEIKKQQDLNSSQGKSLEDLMKGGMPGMPGAPSGSPTQKQVQPGEQEPGLNDVAGLTQDVVQGNINQ